MTAITRFAGAISLDDLDRQVRERIEKPVVRREEEEPAAIPGQIMRPETPYASFLRFCTVNFAGFALVGAAWTRGWLDTLLSADRTGLTLTIIAVFFAGLVLCAFRLWRVARETSASLHMIPPPKSWAATYLSTIAGRDSGARSIAASALQLRLGEWIAPVRHVANSLVLLGLIGTVLGFIISLSGVDPDAVSDVSAISPMVSTLLGGMSVALYTTLAGAALNLWLMVNHRLLAAATGGFVASIVEQGERNEHI